MPCNCVTFTFNHGPLDTTICSNSFLFPMDHIDLHYSLLFSSLFDLSYSSNAHKICIISTFFVSRGDIVCCVSGIRNIHPNVGKLGGLRTSTLV
eukprot:540647_1